MRMMFRRRWNESIPSFGWRILWRVLSAGGTQQQERSDDVYRDSASLSFISEKLEPKLLGMLTNWWIIDANISGCRENQKTELFRWGRRCRLRNEVCGRTFCESECTEGKDVLWVQWTSNAWYEACGTAGWKDCIYALTKSCVKSRPKCRNLSMEITIPKRDFRADSAPQSANFVDKIKTTWNERG